jgi:hypothetical protein
VELYLHFPNKPSWRGAELKHREKFTFYLVAFNKSLASRNNCLYCKPFLTSINAVPQYISSSTPVLSEMKLVNITEQFVHKFFPVNFHLSHLVEKDTLKDLHITN